jgi:hypothetical protein
MECTTCIEMTKEYLELHPEKSGYVLCESCFEKSKEFICYIDLPYGTDIKMTHEKYIEWCEERGLYTPNLCKCGNSFHYLCFKCNPNYLKKEE